MNPWKKIILAAIFLALLIPLVSAQDEASEKSERSRIVQVIKDNTTSNIIIHAGVIEIEAPSKKDISELRKEYDDYLSIVITSPEGFTDYVLSKTLEDAYKKMIKSNYHINLTTIKDVNISFSYVGIDGLYHPIPGCGLVKASNVKIISGIKDPLDPAAVAGPFYYAECKIPIDNPQFKGTCKSILVSYIAQAGEKEALPGSTTVCDLQTNLSTAFTSGIATIFSPTNENFPICFTGFLLIGLLFASMFASGKSPLSLLDLTTPRLPSPKGLAAGGQILGPFGYTEMKKTTSAKVGAALAALKPYIGKIGATGLPVVAAASMSLGQKYGFGKEAVAAMGKLQVSKGDINIDKWTAGQHEAFSKLLTGVEQKAKVAGDRRAQLDIGILRDWYLGRIQYQRLEVITSHPDIAKKSAIINKTQSALRSAFGRFQMLGPFMLGGHDSVIRSMRVMGRYTKGITGEALRIAIGKNQLKEIDEAAKKSKAAKALENWIKYATGAKLAVGGFAPVLDQAAQLYKNLRNEAYYDMMRDILQKTYQKYGMQFDVSLEELTNLAHVKGVDILARSGFTHSAQLAAIEQELRAILSKGHLTPQQKLEAMMELAQRYGVQLDAGIRSALRHIGEIDTKNVDDHVRLVMLYDYMASEHNIQNTAKAAEEFARNPDRFVFAMGHDVLPHDRLWSAFLLRNMLYNWENNHSGGIQEGLVQNLLHFQNRLYGVDQESVPHLIKLLTPEGRKFFVESYGFDPVLNPSQVRIDQMKALLYGEEWMIREHKMKKGSSDVHVFPGGKAWWWEENRELGPRPEWWKVDMKRPWVFGMKDSWADVTLKRWVDFRFSKSHVPYFDAEVERALNSKYADVKTWTPDLIKNRTNDAKKMLLLKLLHEDIMSFMGSEFGRTAYSTTNNVVNEKVKNIAAVLAASMTDRGVSEFDHQLQFLKNFDVNNKTDRKKLAEIFQAYGKEIAEFISQPINYDRMVNSKYAFKMTYAGGMIPVIADMKGLPAAPYDRPLGGYVAIKDNRGKYRRFDPDHTRIYFEGHPELERVFNMVSGEKDARVWKEHQFAELGNRSFLEAAKDWAGKNDYEKQKVFNAVLWRFAGTTDDWKSFWKDSSITIKPKRDVVPFSPLSWRMISDRELPIVEGMQKYRNFMLDVGDFFSRTSLAAAGPLLTTTYDISPYSEYYRENSMRLTQKIMSFDKKDWDMLLADVASPVERERLRKLYMDVGMAHFPYHNIWSYAIDRHPGRADTSFGAHQTWGGFFHFGPINQLPMRATYRAIMSRGEYLSFELQNWPMRIARKLSQPFAHVVRGIQQAIQGYPSRWDQSFSPLKPWDYTQPRFRELLSTLNPVTTFYHSYSPENTSLRKFWDKTFGKVFNYESQYFRNPAVHADLAGKRIGDGMKQQIADIMYVRSESFATARTGSVNPGVSRYDQRLVLQMDEAAAERLYARGGINSGFFKHDEYVRDSALNSTVKRNMDFVSLAIRREHELRGFGLLQNPIYGWFNPALFWWHMPLLPKFSLKELTFNTIQRQRFGGGSETTIDQKVSSVAERTYQALIRGVTPWNTADQVWCPKCQSSGHRGGICRRCHHMLYAGV